ncbi:ubiquitin carboxyl-terminal hydrolase 33-like isoform X2 [Chelmon rostratus]|uniref:ubiquitin carboxyl-terminal hydrolase 33-like isoform X2 n=1 Tax=Chelmon rostratus TaxID=109905 RepID=UPI001BE948F8|nr:ubiquitin carboxyl-terminal hydrolase 33-like isoform X2 [Chelmon rostratus]
MEEHASPKPSKGRHDNGTNADEEEHLAAKKPRVTTSDGPTDAGGERQEQHETAMECQTACETNPEGWKDETSHLNELVPDDVEQKRNLGESDADNEEKGNTGQNEEDEVQAEREEASSHQAGGEEGVGRHEKVMSETSSSETKHDINLTADVSLATPSQVQTGGDEEENVVMHEEAAQSSIAQENTNGKFEELKETEADDAPVKAGEKSENSCERLDDEPDMREQRATADLTCEAGERQGEDAGLEELKGQEGKAAADEDPQMGHSEEDEGERRMDLRKETLSPYSGGEMTKIDMSVSETSHERSLTSSHDCATLSEVKSSGDEKKVSLYGDATYSRKKRDHYVASPYREPRLGKAKRTYKTQRVTQLHYGLYNQGSTCYLNSVLQVLCMTPELHERLDSELQTDQELRKVFEGLKEDACETEDITRSLGIGNVYEQRDAAECLGLILRRIVPQASAAFYGKLTYLTECSNGHVINNETNRFWSLPLSLKDVHGITYSVEKSLERFFQTKTITGSTKVYCKGCDEDVEASSGCEMVECPQILTVLLKRFDFDHSTMSYVKSDCYVDVPFLLQLKNKTYSLYGMVNHMGSLRGGHYTATILSNQDNTWYEFDDARVHKVKNQPFAKSRTYNSRTVYLLMYRGGTSPPADTRMSKIKSFICHVFPCCLLLCFLARGHHLCNSKFFINLRTINVLFCYLLYPVRNILTYRPWKTAE